MATALSKTALFNKIDEFIKLNDNEDITGDILAEVLKFIAISAYNSIDDTVGSDQVQADWDQANASAANFIKNKTTVLNELATKVSKATGKSLILDSLIAKLQQIEIGAQKNVNANWNETDVNSDAYVLGKGVVTDLISNVQSDIDLINSLLASDDVNLDELQELVTYIKANRADLDALSITSIIGLQDALDDFNNGNGIIWDAVSRSFAVGGEFTSDIDLTSNDKSFYVKNDYVDPPTPPNGFTTTVYSQKFGINKANGIYGYVSNDINSKSPGFSVLKDEVYFYRTDASGLIQMIKIDSNGLIVHDPVGEIGWVGAIDFTVNALNNDFAFLQTKGVKDYVASQLALLNIGNIDNTSDVDKPTSNAVQTQLDLINTILTSDDVSLDELQELVNYIKANRADLDALGISSVVGLQTALDHLSTAIAEKAEKGDQGETGLQGDQGETGLTGDQGEPANLDVYSITEADYYFANRSGNNSSVYSKALTLGLSSSVNFDFALRDNFKIAIAIDGNIIFTASNFHNKSGQKCTFETKNNTTGGYTANFDSVIFIKSDQSSDWNNLANAINIVTMIPLDVDLGGGYKIGYSITSFTI